MLASKFEDRDKVLEALITVALMFLSENVSDAEAKIATSGIPAAMAAAIPLALGTRATSLSPSWSRTANRPSLRFATIVRSFSDYWRPTQSCRNTKT